jgi:hypothetical protein
MYSPCEQQRPLMTAQLLKPVAQRLLVQCKTLGGRDKGDEQGAIRVGEIKQSRSLLMELDVLVGA